MKKSVITGYIIVFAVLVVVPMCYLLFRFARDRDCPKPSETGLSAFTSEFETYAYDKTPFREEMLYGNALFYVNVLRQSPSDVAIMGRDGWFFYKGKQDPREDPLADYTGTNLFTEEELARIADNMTQSLETARKRGASFVVVLAANKARIYGDYMPSSYGPPAENCRIAQVYSYLTEHTEVPVVYTPAVLSAYREAHPEERLYIKHDCHWNFSGAYLASCEARRLLSLAALPELYTLKRVDVDPPDGDIALLMGLGDYFKGDKEGMLVGYSPYTQTVAENLPSGHLRTNDAHDAPNGSLFVVGDSFSVSMLEYVGCDFNEAYMNYRYNYTPEMLAEHRPDVIVYECVERFLGYMLDFHL